MFVAVGGRTVTQWTMCEDTGEETMQLRCAPVLQVASVAAVATSHNQHNQHKQHSGPSEYLTTIAHCAPRANTYRFAIGGGGGSVWLASATLGTTTTTTTTTTSTGGALNALNALNALHATKQLLKCHLLRALY